MDNMELKVLLEIRKEVSDELFRLRKDYIKSKANEKVMNEMPAKIEKIKQARKISVGCFEALNAFFRKELEAHSAAWNSADKNFQLQIARITYLTEKLNIIDIQVGFDVSVNERDNILRAMV